MARQSTEERRYKLAQIIVSEGQVKVGELANQFGVSTETIRKDLIQLEEEGIAKKSHGRAVVSSDLIERPYTQKLSERVEEKMGIAKEALALIPKRGAIFLDSGSTTFEVAKLLTLQTALTIFTNSISAMYILAPTSNIVYLMGGKIRASSMAVIGGWALDALRTIQVDIAFLGTDGFLGREGPCSASFEEVDVKKAIIGQSKRKYVLADHSKFTRSDMFSYAEWKDIDGMITDSQAPKSELERIGNHIDITIYQGTGSMKHE